MLVNLDYVLKKAQAEHYGVGLFNTTDTDMLEAAIAAAEELNSPIIIGTAEVLLPSGELKLIAPSIIAAAKRAKVPVVVHYDHGLTFDRCMEALKLGFTSIMFDGSAGDPEKNITDTREIAKIAHSFGATVEGEIGHVGEASTGDNAVTDSFTTPEEALEFIEKTGVDALAIAIGTAHGVYKGIPKLDLDRLSEIREVVSIPLVLHGTSGVPDETVKECVNRGICKVNYATDLRIAFTEGVKEVLSEKPDTIDPKKYIAAGREKVKAYVMSKMIVCGSNGRA